MSSDLIARITKEFRDKYKTVRVNKISPDTFCNIMDDILDRERREKVKFQQESTMSPARNSRLKRPKMMSDLLSHKEERLRQFEQEIEKENEMKTTAQHAITDNNESQMYGEDKT